MKKLMAASLLLTVTLASEAYATTVRAEGGNITTVDEKGAARKLTKSGLDSEPVVSPDSRQIVFVRQTPLRMIDAGIGLVSANEIWVMNIDGTGQRILVEGRSDDDPKLVLAALHSPVFSPDGRVVYFLSAAWATSESVHAVDLTDANQRFVTPGNSLEVVPAGPDAGKLIVNQHRYFPAGGSYDWFWLISPTGEDKGAIGPEDDDVANFKARRPR